MRSVSSVQSWCVGGLQANSRATGGKGLGGSMAVVVSHADQVLELPAGAQLLASSKSAAAEIWSHGSNVLAVQGHPEMTPALCIKKVVPALVAKGVITAAEGEAAVASLQVRCSLIMITPPPPPRDESHTVSWTSIPSIAVLAVSTAQRNALVRVVRASQSLRFSTPAARSLALRWR